MEAESGKADFGQAEPGEAVSGRAKSGEAEHYELGCKLPSACRCTPKRPGPAAFARIAGEGRDPISEKRLFPHNYCLANKKDNCLHGTPNRADTSRSVCRNHIRQATQQTKDSPTITQKLRILGEFQTIVLIDFFGIFEVAYTSLSGCFPLSFVEIR